MSQQTIANTLPSETSAPNQWSKENTTRFPSTLDDITLALNMANLTYPHIYARPEVTTKRNLIDKIPFDAVRHCKGAKFDSQALALKESRNQGYEMRFFPHNDVEFFEIYSQIMTLLKTNENIYNAVASVSGFRAHDQRTTPTLFVHVDGNAQLVLDDFKKITVPSRNGNDIISADYCIGVTPILAYGSGFYTDLISIVDRSDERGYADFLKACKRNEDSDQVDTNEQENRQAYEEIMAKNNQLLKLWYKSDLVLFIDHEPLI